MGPLNEPNLGVCQAWRCLARAESIAQRKLLEQRAQEGMGELGLEAKLTGRETCSPLLAFGACGCFVVRQTCASLLCLHFVGTLRSQSETQELAGCMNSQVLQL